MSPFLPSMIAVAVCVILALGAGPVIADESDSVYFEQLRVRKLFTLAESLCRRRLNDEALAAADRMRLSVELAKTLAAHARSQAEANERLELWNAAHQALKAARDAATEPEQRVELAVQAVLVSCDQAEFDGLLAELNPYDKRQKAGVGTLRERVLGELEQLEAILQEALGRPSASKQLALARYRALQKGVLYQSGELLAAQGRAFERGTPERSAALLKAEQKLKRVASTTTDDRIVWLSQVSLARVMRVKLETDRANAMLTAIERDEPPSDIVDEVVAERVELFAATNRLPDAADLLRTYRLKQPQFSARLAFLAVRTWLDLSRAMTARRQMELAAELNAEAKRAIETDPSLATGYWAHRARLIWDQFEEASRYGVGLSALLQEARGRYAAGDIAESLSAFRRAFDEAAENGPAELSFELGLTLARLQLEQRQVDDALSLLERLLKLHAEHARVAEVDLLRAICLGRRFQTTPTKSLREAYESALALHVERYSAAPTAADAAWMAAQLKEKLSLYEAALEFYARIPAQHAHAGDALAAAARCYRQLAESNRSKPSTSTSQRDWEQEALQKLTPIADQLAEQPELAESQVEFLTHAAFIAVTMPTLPRETAKWIRRLDQWLAAVADDDADVKRITARRSDIVSLKTLLTVRQPSALESKQRIEELKTVPTTTRLVLLKSLTASIENLPLTERRSLATMTVGALGQAALDAPQPSTPTLIEIERMLAAAYGTLGDAVNAKAAQRRMERLQP